MKFKAGTRRKPIEYEKYWVKQWKKDDTFKKSVENRPKDNSFVFYDGPPFITGVPHHGTLLISAIKDAVARYQTMQGKRVERRWGWDCHGLPAEVYVEKKLGIKNRSEIGTRISVREYVASCRLAMEKGGAEWEEVIDRLGRWVDMNDAYKTMDNDYMESIWWAFNELYTKGKIYEGEKVLLYCTRDATPISKSEVAMENSYKEVTDPSLFVYLDLVDDDASLLAWTTTPWTLPANVAVAVNPKFTYAVVEYQGKKLVVAKDLVEKVLTDEKHQPLDYKLIRELKGSELVGKKYHPLFENHGQHAHVVVDGEFVTKDDGTGIVHIAPAYGEDDFNLSEKYNLPVVHTVDENGLYSSGQWLGKNIWETNKEIAKTLLAEGRGLKVEYVKHEYPHCHRCGTKLMYRAHSSWFLDVQNQKEDMLEASEATDWVPTNLKEKRFKNVILSAPDWNLSRDRFWATPIPVWKGKTPAGDEVIKSFGSYKEFEDFTGKKLDDYHLPSVMDIEFELDGAKMQHINKVIDCWFESGSMPFAQFHYPFENKQKFEDSFPADFIIEAVDQVRGWFYSLTAVNVALFGRSPFKNLICSGFINAADGQKISKKLKNYTDPAELMDKTSVDALRLFLMSSPLTSGEDANLVDKDIIDAHRKLSMIWNMYDFFTMYADVDGWEFDGRQADPTDMLTNKLDIWIVSRLHQLMRTIDQGLSSYKLQEATRNILPFIDDASNWYVRRSRKRFWKSDNDSDKNDAYKTLHYVLTQLAIVMAPFTPFLSEELYSKLTGADSVHLLNWPKAGKVNTELVDSMAVVRAVINEALAARSREQLKVRQPLSSLKITSAHDLNLTKEMLEIIEEEVNVKNVNLEVNTSQKNLIVNIDTKLTPELLREGLMREVIRLIQSSRKKAGLEVDDRIFLVLSTTDKKLRDSIDYYSKQIAEETLAKKISDTGKLKYQYDVEVDGSSLTILLEKN